MIEFETTNGERVTLNVQIIGSVEDDEDNNSSVITTTDGREFNTKGDYDSVTSAIRLAKAGWAIA